MNENQISFPEKEDWGKCRPSLEGETGYQDMEKLI